MLALTLVLVPLWSTHAAAQAKTLKLAHVGTLDGAIGRGASRFANELRAVSAGAMDVQIIPLAALGGIRENWAQLQAGSLDMQVIDLSAISLLKEAAHAQVSLLPFIFADQTHFRNFAESRLLAELLDPVRQATHIRYLGIVEDRSPRVISTTTTPVTTVADLKGVKIRVPPHPMFIEVFRLWGASPTPLPASEMFMALKSGMVDGEDNGVINLVAGSNIKVIRHFTPINWNRSGVAAWISEHTWKTLTGEQRQWIMDASTRSAESSRLDYDQAMETAMRELTESGITLHEPDLTSFAKAAATMEKAYEGTVWPAGLAASVRALR
ncbi:MAG: TRAP transporter substrate-binding protein [Granulosicoccus sp.]|nr:TRAP transporter substrate-binding protein [Granulosicoccus sp.]